MNTAPKPDAPGYAATCISEADDAAGALDELNASEFWQLAIDAFYRLCEMHPDKAPVQWVAGPWEQDGKLWATGWNEMPEGVAVRRIGEAS